jgi:hypothetical protein
MSVRLFGRWSRLVVGNLELKPDKAGETLKYTFTVSKNLQGAPNTAEIAVYNLNREHRAQIEQIKTNETKGLKIKTVPVSLEAGYGLDSEGGPAGKDASLIFLGHLRSFLTTREGPDLVTNIGTGDGEVNIRRARVALSFAPGVPTDTAFRQLAEAVGVDRGNLDDAVKTLKGKAIFPMGTVFSGSASRELDAVCRSLGLEWSVQNGKLQILLRGQALKEKAILLNKDSGMLGEPTIDTQGVMGVSMLMAPDVYPGRKMVVQGERLRGQYRIEETSHKGDTMGGEWAIEIKGRRY